MKRLRQVLPALALAASLIPAARLHAQAVGAAEEAPALAPAPHALPIGLAQHLGAVLPLQAVFVDSTGRAGTLGDQFQDGQPAILVLGYLRCPQLCGLLMHGLLEAMHDAGPAVAATHVVFASIDPQDTPADAAARGRVVRDYARYLEGNRPAAAAAHVDLLTGSPASIAALAERIGEVHVATAEAGDPADAGRFAHPAGILVVTPSGRISRYLMGVRFDPAELRTAIDDARHDRVGAPVDRLALNCAHVDPHVGRWSAAVLIGLRGFGCAMVLSLALLALRRLRRVPSRGAA